MRAYELLGLVLDLEVIQAYDTCAPLPVLGHVVISKHRDPHLCDLFPGEPL